MNKRRGFLKTSLALGISMAGCLRMSDDSGQSQQEDQATEAAPTENSAGEAEEDSNNDSGDVAELSISFHDPSYGLSVGKQSGQYLDTLYTRPEFSGVIAASEDGTIGLHTPEGDIVWRDGLENQLRRTSIIGSQNKKRISIHLVDSSLSVYGFDAESGEQLWQTESVLAEDLSEDQVTRGVLELVDDTIIGFFTVGYETTTLEGFAPGTGERLWVLRPAEKDDTYDHLAWGSSENAPLPRGRILFDMANRMGSIDQDGNLRWEPEISDAISGIDTPTVTDGQTVYLPTGSALIKYHPDSGTTDWKYSALDQITSPITLHDDVVLFGAEDNGVYALDATSGEQVWRFQTNNYVRAPPVVFGETVYLGSADRTIYAVDLDRGEERSTVELDGAIGTMERSDTTLYAGTEAGLYGLGVSE